MKKKTKKLPVVASHASTEKKKFRDKELVLCQMMKYTDCMDDTKDHINLLIIAINNMMKNQKLNYQVSLRTQHTWWDECNTISLYKVI